MSNEEEYIPVNKGHFELDTNERMRRFSNILANGWENQYKEYRNLWNMAPKNKQVLDYPILVDLELSSKCNLLCPMCPTITDSFREDLGKSNMEFSLATKVIDEVAGKIYALRLSWVGEPTLNKNLINIIKYAKDKGIKEISFLTNGGKLDLDYFIQLEKAGIDWITISIDGTDERYNAIRKPLKFHETFKKIQKIAKYKKENNLNKPVIKIQSIWPAIRDNAEEFYNMFLPYVDMISYNPLIDYLHNDTDIVYENNFSCPQLYQRITVSASGEVAMCSNDDDVKSIIGNAKYESIHNIWHGDKLNKIRNIHNQKDGFKSMEICKLCYYPRKMIPNEHVKIGNRNITIENYINRKQNAGE